MHESQFFMLGGNIFYTSVHLWCTMDNGRPMSLTLTEKTQNMIRIMTAHKTPHKIILARDIKSVRTISLLNSLIEIGLQLRSDNLISIYYQHPIR